jgi:hypothetical protein
VIDDRADAVTEEVLLHDRHKTSTLTSLLNSMQILSSLAEAEMGRTSTEVQPPRINNPKMMLYFMFHAPWDPKSWRY